VGGIDPTSTNACSGTPVTFTLTGVTGSAPLSYQWRSNGVDIAGETSSTYTLASVAVVHAASYDCVVTNDCGTNTSAAGTLTVNTPPITTNSTASTALNKPLTISTNKLVKSSYDADNDGMTITAASATNGTALYTGTNIIYTPVTDYSGDDRIDYTVSDGQCETVGSVFVTVRPANTQSQNIISIVNNGGSSVTITFAGIPNRYYIVQSTTNLALPVPPNWEPISTNQANGNGIWSVTDPVVFGSRWYRSTGGTTNAP
jgi:hypothetical protein